MWGRMESCGGLATRPERRETTRAQRTKLPHKAWVSAVLHFSRRRQGAINTFDSGVLRFPEALRFHLLQVGVGIAEARPDVFLVGEQPFFLGARAHIQDVHLAAAAEQALEPATQPVPRSEGAG